MKAMDVLWDKPDNTFVPNFLLKVCGQLQDQGYTLNGSKVSQVDYHVADADMPKNYPNHTQIQEMNGRW